MPVDSLLTPFRTQLVHSKIIVTRASLPLAINLLWIFDSPQSSIFRSKAKNKGTKKVEVANSKSNYEIFRWNQY